MVVFASLVVGFCSGFPSLFGGAPLTLLHYKYAPTSPKAVAAGIAVVDGDGG